MGQGPSTQCLPSRLYPRDSYKVGPVGSLLSFVIGYQLQIETMLKFRHVSEMVISNTEITGIMKIHKKNTLH